ncbi:hypothetical protein R3W88_018660 [Solanum pinnatisectum]|uniref:DUF4283 domain-containing protein n=1 Tax=Solanum pinnatisectum TaxID=50273 RepID=A0AAV9L3N2_9SOLN|nr:hypothetical protein R3W88_018660 [Solanum pinnatisectum]
MPELTCLGSTISQSKEKVSKLRKITGEMGEEVSERKWASLFKVVELCKVEVELETQKWEQVLILYVVGTEPTIATLERYIEANYIVKPKVYYHNDGYFLVKFTTLEDRDEVFYAGPHTLNQKPIIVKKWTPNFDFTKEVIQTIPILVKFPYLPLNYWGVQSLCRIRSGLGIPIYIDECTTQVDKISYARLLIEMDITRTLPTEIKVEDPNGRSFKQVVKYEWVLSYCRTCLIIGHTCKRDDAEIKAKPKQNKQKIEWKQRVHVKQGVDEEQIENGCSEPECNQRPRKEIVAEE